MHIERIAQGLPTADGDGVRLTRMIGTREVMQIDPFLMLDRFDSDDPDAYIGGFPDHPHRGFETVTVMLDGRLRHRDSTGGEGVIGPGDVQWMTAGRGIIHSEMPEQIDGRMRGFQLWINLPATQKMSEPGYQDILRENIPVVRGEGCDVHVFAGAFEGSTGPARSRTPLRLLRADLQPGATFALTVPERVNAFLCVYEGSVLGTGADGGPLTVSAAALAVLGGDGELSVRAGETGAALFYGEGLPIDEPVARYGPFVMNSEMEIHQAIADYRAGRFA